MKNHLVFPIAVDFKS